MMLPIQKYFISWVVVAALWGVGAAVADGADEAGDGEGLFVLHAGIRGGASALWASRESVIETEAVVGYGFGLHLAPMWHVTGVFALGPLLSVATLTHETDTLATAIHTPALGVMGRLHLGEAWVLTGDVDYVFGRASTSRAGGGFASAQLPPVGGSSDVHGVQVGVEVLRRWEIVPRDVALEVGLNLSYQALFAVDLADVPVLNALALGLTVKAWRGL